MVGLANMERDFTMALQGLGLVGNEGNSGNRDYTLLFSSENQQWKEISKGT